MQYLTQDEIVILKNLCAVKLYMKNLKIPFPFLNVAREGGLIGKKSGPPPISGPTPHGDEGLPAAFKRGRNR